MKKNLIKLSFIATVPNVLAQPIMLSTHHQQLSQEKKETLKLKRDVSDCNLKSSAVILNKIYDIGTIDINNESTIVEAFLSYLETNPTDYINVAERILDVRCIRYNSADIHIFDNLGEWTELIVRVNFQAIRISLSSVITDTDLGEIPDNSAQTIYNYLQQQNADLISSNIGVNILSITTSSAIITNVRNDYQNENEIRISFTTRNYILNTFIHNVDLGVLPDAREQTIINRLRALNPEIPTDFNLGTITSVYDFSSFHNQIRNMEVVLTGVYQPETVDFLFITRPDNYFFYRPASQEEIESGMEIISFGTTNNIVLRFFMNSDNTEHSNLNSQQDNSNIFNFNSLENDFCLDSDINNKEKRYFNLEFICSTQVLNFRIINKYNTQGENVKSGYAYLGTNNGVYLSDEKGRVIGKFEGIKGEVVDIKLDDNGNAFAVIENGEVYYLNLKDWSSIKLNLESKKLDQNIELYFNEDKSNMEISSDWWYQTPNDIIVKTFNLGPINPTYYTYIAFIGAPEEFSKTRVSWGNEAYYSRNNLLKFGKFKVKDKLLNFKIKKMKLNLSDSFRNMYLTYLTVQKDKQKSSLAGIEYEQFIGLNFYWKNGNYYLQIVAHQQCNSKWTNIGGAMFLNLGNGIKLYN